MNCSEFRREYQSLLDLRETETLTPEMSAHRARCASCTGFAEAMNAVDGALRRQPRYSLSESLKRDLLAIPLAEMFAECSLKAYVRKALLITLPGAGLLLLGTALLPQEGFFWLRLSVLSAGLTFFWIKVLKQKRLAVSLE
jgi:hypothetical protein